MKIDTAQPIIGYDGEPVVQPTQKKDPDTGEYVTKMEPVTVQWVIQQVCNASIEAMPFNAESLVRCGNLATRAYEPDPDYTDADRQYILKRAEHVTPPLTYCFLAALFESPGEPEAYGDEYK